MLQRSLVMGLTLIGVLVAAGCNRPFREAPNPVAVAPQAYDPVFDATIDVLRDYGFRVDRQDYRFGVVTTHPLDSPTAFEPWRPHNTTGEQVWQSTFTNLRRRVNVFLEPPADPRAEPPAETPAEPPNSETPSPQRDEDYQLRVEVLMENLQLPQRRLIRAEARFMFSMLDETPTEWRERGIVGQYWQVVGRDPYLEDRLVHAILTRAQRQ